METVSPLPARVFWILLVLSGAPRHGYAILKETRARSEAGLGLGPTTLYRTLYRLVEEGLVESVAAPVADADARRQYYGLTDSGAEVLEAEVRRLERMVETARSTIGRPVTERGR